MILAKARDGNFDRRPGTRPNTKLPQRAPISAAYIGQQSRRCGSNTECAGNSPHGSVEVEGGIKAVWWLSKRCRELRRALGTDSLLERLDIGLATTHKHGVVIIAFLLVGARVYVE